MYAKFSNECTNSGMEWIPVEGQKQVLDNEIMKQMEDKGDGNYTVTITVDRPGKIILNIFKYKRGGVTFDAYTEKNWEGMPETSWVEDMNLRWEKGQSTWPVNGYLSGKYYFLLRAPITGTVKIGLFSTYIAKVYSNNTYLGNLSPKFDF